MKFREFENSVGKMMLLCRTKGTEGGKDRRLVIIVTIDNE